MNLIQKCPIWKTPASVQETGNGIDSYTIDSHRAGGIYRISGSAYSTNLQLDDQEKAILTSWMIRQREMGIDQPPILTTSEISKSSVSNLKPLSLLQRGYGILKYLDSKIPRLGGIVSFRSHTAISTLQDMNDPYWLFLEALAWSESLTFSELEFLLDYLQEENWIKTDKPVHSTITCRITPVGYRYLNESEYSIRSSSQAFVAMWFDESMFQVYSDGIAPAIQDAGYEPLRIDQKEHVNKIDDEIISEIRRSKFIIADFTHGEKGARGGVYYEAGFAFGLNIPVIFTCREDFIDKVHFDTRQYAHIDWKDPQDLRERLTKRICSVIGDGPNKE